MKTKQDLREQLLKEHSRRNADFILEWLDNDKKKVALLMELFFENEYRISQRAAMIVGHLADKKKELIAPYLSSMVEHLEQPVHGAVKRNIVRTLQSIDVPEKDRGLLMETCFTQLNNREEKVAVQVFSMSVITRYLKYYPELASELKSSIEWQWEHQSTGFKSRGRKTLQAIKKLKLRH